MDLSDPTLRRKLWMAAALLGALAVGQSAKAEQVDLKHGALDDAVGIIMTVKDFSGFTYEVVTSGPVTPVRHDGGM